jgi:hypothetical protein
MRLARPVMGAHMVVLVVPRKELQILFLLVQVVVVQV